MEDFNRICDNKNETIKIPKTHQPLEYLDYVCTAFFTLELIVRVIFSPQKLEFFKSVMNIIDILALLPLYVQIILEKADEAKCLGNHRVVLETIIVLRIIRIFRIFHLVKHYRALKILVHAIKASLQELLMLSIFLFIAMLVFSTLVFYAERSGAYSVGGGNFTTIPIGFWWSIVTMTTVGYGDVYPRTSFGYVVGAFCAVCGVLLLALTIPVLSNNFALFYLHARTRDDIANKPDDRQTWTGTNDRSKMVGDDPAPQCRSGDTRALLGTAESSSLVDETGLMMVNRNAGSGANSTPQSRDNISSPGSNKLNVKAPTAEQEETVI